MARASNRGQQGALTRLGALPPGAVIAFGVALVLMLASAGLVVFTLSAKRSTSSPATAPAGLPTASAFIALASTSTPTQAPTATSTPRPKTSTPTPRPTMATPRIAATPAPLGAGQTTAIRGLAGSMLATTGGVALPTPGAITPPGAALPPATIPPYNPPPIATMPPLPSNPPVYNPPVYNPPSNPPVYNPPVVKPPYNPAPTIPPGSALTPVPGGSGTAVATPPGNGALPTVAFPTPGATDTRYALTYTLSADLAAVPKSAYAYQLTWRDFTNTEFEQLARALGVPGPVRVTPGGFTASGNGRLTLSKGLLTYMSPLAVGTGDATPTAAVPAATTTPAAASSPVPTATVTVGGQPTPSAQAGSAPPATRAATTSPAATGAAATTTPANGMSDDAARAAAKQWLSARGLFPANADSGEVWRPVFDQTVVIFHPLEPQGRVLGDPQVLIVFDPAGNVRMAQYHWPATSAPLLSRLRSSQEAWADLLAGKSFTQVNWTIPAGTAPGTTFSGAATVTKVSIGWSSAVDAAGQTYLMPVYAFEGTTTLKETGATVPFRVYAAATSP